jgi:hypothetical protein
VSFAAAATTKLVLGTGICLIPERDPIVTAKCVASLDQLSGGRFVFGIDEALLEVPDRSRDEILRLLDDYAPLAA